MKVLELEEKLKYNLTLLETHGSSWSLDSIATKKEDNLKGLNNKHGEATQGTWIMNLRYYYFPRISKRALWIGALFNTVALEKSDDVT